MACEEKCKSQCKRKDLGNSINIRQLELACMNYGKEVKARVLLKPNKERKSYNIWDEFKWIKLCNRIKKQGLLC
ncbi:hypothetical protein [Terrisporobacter mayombei]|uniref:Uncharacterized protein n=1 Tax=Terrisporobacter mayombei TaxID=1541 RepID=A0ABY9Q8D5_9FIRM|nr:hypothetical protein [Terrisporobacter mayombei]WMT83599.1 hypothetical protein TEMA_41180 [Terrisporobacter mayombei]